MRTLSEMTKEFIHDLWGLDKTGRFPKESDLASSIVFEGNEIYAQGFANAFARGCPIKINDDNIEVEWASPAFKVYAADPHYFDKVLGAIAHIALMASMGWDTTDKFRAWTELRIEQRIKQRELERRKQRLMALKSRLRKILFAIVSASLLVLT